MDTTQLGSLLEKVLPIAKQAGEIIMGVYRDGFDIDVKSDQSPVTTADLAANAWIVAELEKLETQFPVLSEESANILFAERSTWATYWLVDPLDGTKEFIHRRDTFTVNIALIHHNQPVLGVIYAPALDISYYAADGNGCYKQQGEEQPQTIQVREMSDTPVIAGSRTHGSTRLEVFLDNVGNDLGDYELVTMGSSLKMCLVAEGSIDLYPRLGPTSEWDTGAAQCIVEQAGGRLVQTDMTAMRYNTKDSLLNPHFFTIGNNAIDWMQYLPK